MKLKSLSAGLAGLCQIAAALLFVIVCALNFTQVFGRYVSGSSLPWAEEVMRYTMVWVMMLGSVAAVYRAEHMAVEGLGDLLARNHRHMVLTAVYLVAALFCLLLLYYGWGAALGNQRQRAAASGLSMMWPYLAIPVGAALILLQIALCALSGFHEHGAQEERL